MGLVYHTSLCVLDLERAAAFYDKVLAAIDCGRRYEELPLAIAYGRDRNDFWLQTPGHLPFLKPTVNSHFSFRVGSEQEVIAFYEAAVETGAEVVLEARLHTDIWPGYFGTIFRDPDGNLPECYTMLEAAD